MTVNQVGDRVDPAEPIKSPGSMWAALPPDHKANDDEWIRSRIDAGATVRRIAREAGCSDDTIYKRLSALGLKAKRGIKRSDGLWHDPVWLRSCKDAGMSLRQIAAAAGCSRATIIEAFKAHRDKVPDAMEQPAREKKVRRRAGHHSSWQRKPEEPEVIFDCLDCPESVTTCRGCRLEHAK